MIDQSRHTTPAAAEEPARPRARRPLSFLRLATRRSGLGTTLVLLGLMVLPSAMLGYLSWRAIDHERTYSRERLRESYRQFAGLAARQIDHELGELEAGWSGDIERLLEPDPDRPIAERLVTLAGHDALITGYFLLSAPGVVAYPPSAVSGPGAARGGRERETEGREHGLFNDLVARGEELEYHDGDLPAAIAVYREAGTAVSNARLKAMAESYVGRAQLKHGDHAGALATFRHLLDHYPEALDLNRMYLRLLAQYQIAVALEGMGRTEQALETLLELNRDLVRRSDAINTLQYSYYSELIQTLAPQLLETSNLRQRAAYEQAFRALGEGNKRRISERYFVQLLDAELSEMVIRGRHFSPRIQYLSTRGEGEPFLVAYRPLPDAQGVHVSGLLGAQINLDALRRELSSEIANLKSGSGADLAVVGPKGQVVIGDANVGGAPFAAEALAPPFDFWQVAIYLNDVPTAMKRLDLRASLWLWMISLLLLTVLVAAYAFIVRARRQAYLARAQTTFVSNVSHELKTPLASIRMFTELLEMSMDEKTAAWRKGSRTSARRNLGIIRQECDRLSRLIDRVLDFSRMERRDRVYAFEERDLGEVVSRVVDSFRPHAEAQGFELRLAIEDGLPTLRIDADAVAQVLLNLLANSVQYSADTKEIDVRVRRDGAALAVDVADRGIGIEAQELGKVFDRFYSSWRRMDSRAQGGLGLGLTLSREMVRAHGGSITVQSVVGRGSTFTVHLPLITPLGQSLLPESSRKTSDHGRERRVAGRGQ